MGIGTHLPLATPANPHHNLCSSMRWLRLLGTLFFLAILFFFGAFYTFRAVARKHARELETRLATLSDPADINFPGAAENSEWFAQYQPFLEHYAQLASAIHADVFCVGVELEKMSGNEQAWRKLIARARELYPGPL